MILRSSCRFLTLVLAIALALGGCAAKKPALYPNEHYEQVGAAAAERDVEACIRRAEEFGANDGQNAEIAKDTAQATVTGAAIGAAAGAAGGAIHGDAGGYAASGAAGGAAGGLVAGLFRGLFNRGPTETHKNFVTQCLRDHGYKVIGWE